MLRNNQQHSTALADHCTRRVVGPSLTLYHDSKTKGTHAQAQTQHLMGGSVAVPRERFGRVSGERFQMRFLRGFWERLEDEEEEGRTVTDRPTDRVLIDRRLV